MPSKPLAANRLPPTECDSEMALLGSMLCSDPSCPYGWGIDDVRTTVPAEALTVADHRAVYHAITAAHDAGEPLELLSVERRLQAADPRELPVWRKLLVDLSESFSDVANAMYHARRVRDAWRKRELIRVCNAAASDAYAALADPSEIAATLAGKLQGIEAGAASDRTPIAEADLLRRMQYGASDATLKVRLPTLPALEWKLDGGLRGGELTIIGARPSCGKTSLGLQLCATQSVADSGVPSLFLSAEMSAPAIAQRLLSLRSGVAVRDIRAGRIDEAVFTTHRNRAVLAAGAGPSMFVLADVRDVHALCAIARHHVRRHKVGLIVVDYLGRLNVRGQFDRHDLRVAALSEAFKNLASDTQAAVVVCCQLNRASERDGRLPTLSDLRDSGAIEQDADVVLLLHRPRDCHAASRIIVAKNRQGDCGDVEVVYDRATVTFHPARLEAEPADRAEGLGAGLTKRLR